MVFEDILSKSIMDITPSELRSACAEYIKRIAVTAELRSNTSWKDKSIREIAEESLDTDPNISSRSYRTICKDANTAYYGTTRELLGLAVEFINYSRRQPYDDVVIRYLMAYGVFRLDGALFRMIHPPRRIKITPNELLEARVAPYRLEEPGLHSIVEATSFSNLLKILYPAIREFVKGDKR